MLASRGEPSTPDNAEQGVVWRSIADHWSETGFENEYISVTDVERTSLAKHPWSLGGGGASELKELLEDRAEKRLSDLVASIGVDTITRAGDLLEMPPTEYARLGVEPGVLLAQPIGEEIRDWALVARDSIAVPYDRATWVVEQLERWPGLARFLWPHRSWLAQRFVSGGTRMCDVGMPYWAIPQLPAQKHRTPTSIAWAFVATHNHFVLDRGGKVFNRSAPIIKLPESAAEDDHYALLAYLNSSTACFWMKQVFHDKGSGTDTGKWQDEPAKIAYEFAGTQLGECPIPAPLVDAADVVLARHAAKLAQARAGALEQRLRAELPQSGVALRELLAELEKDDASMLAQLVVLQEELDWRSYVRWDLCERELILEDPSVLLGVGVEVGHRPFELRLARRGLATGIDDHRLSPTLPDHLPDRLAKLWENRCQSLDASAELRIIETPDYKRRWFITPKHLAGAVLTFERRARETLSRMLFEELERGLSEGKAPLRAGDVVRGVLQNGFVSAAIGYLMPERDAAAVLTELLTDDQAPYIACLRFTGAGLEKHDFWRTTWDEQRAEDAGASAVPAVPPKYAREDYSTPRLWELRGKLDVPKERFISYPGCESDEDREPVYGWAGWNHLQRAQALAALYQDRKQREGWSKDRLTPMLAGLLELIPWIKQWHNEPSQEFEGLRLGDYFQSYLEGECRELGLTVEELREWRPERKSRAARATKKAKAAEVEGD
ncbi:MAG: BREX-2 system adenine-specific DNA-methyltransferase PglX [Myxococcales bacterium]|nr:BREX-2 system adenine-specific DNA-methyltransferase PglX [Myxococcales bacterium]